MVMRDERQVSLISEALLSVLLLELHLVGLRDDSLHLGKLWQEPRLLGEVLQLFLDLIVGYWSII